MKKPQSPSRVVGHFRGDKRRHAGRHAGWKSILPKFFHVHADFG